jgi:endonuclease III-like uncharacterized protein
LTVQLEEFKKNTLEKERDSIFKEKGEFERRITELQQVEKVHKNKIEELIQSKDYYRKRYSSLNKEFEEKLKEKQFEIEELENAKTD